MFTRNIILSVFLFLSIRSSGQTFLNYPYYHSGKLSAGFQSNRVFLAVLDTSRFNFQLQHSIVNDKFKYQQFNVAVRYNIEFNKAKIVAGSAYLSNYQFADKHFTLFLEAEHRKGRFGIGATTGWDFMSKDMFYRVGLNAELSARIYLQSSYGSYRNELFGDEESAELGMVYKSESVSLKFANLIPMQEDKLQIKYNRFITSFLITILK